MFLCPLYFLSWHIYVEDLIKFPFNFLLPFLFFFFLTKAPHGWNCISTWIYIIPGSLSYSVLLATDDHAAKSLQSCPTLCNPIDGSPPGSPVPGILQARTLETVAISFSNVWKWKVKVKSLSRVRPLAWTAAHQAPPSTGFSRQEYCSGVPLPSLTDDHDAMLIH